MGKGTRSGNAPARRWFLPRGGERKNREPDGLRSRLEVAHSGFHIFRPEEKTASLHTVLSLRSATRAENPESAVHSSIRAFFVGLLLLLAASSPAQPADIPSVRIDDASAYFAEGFVDVPVFISGASQADGLELSIDYDEMFLGYAFYAGVSEHWSVESVLRYANHRVIITLENISRGSALDEDIVLHTLFVLKGSALDGNDPPPFKVDARLSLGTPSAVPTTTGTHFFLVDDEDNREPLLTGLDSGAISIYYEDGIEVGSGAVTDIAQELTLPLYLTYLKNDRNVFTVGIDYDEMFLNVLRVRGLQPPLADERVDESFGSAGALRFELVLDNGLSGPFARLHVADIVFQYTGNRPPDNEIVVKAELIEGSPAAPGNAEGGGAAYGQTVPGLVTILPPHFVRGNVDSSARISIDGKVSALPELSDATLILDSLFKSGSPIPCYDAADVNDSGLVEIGDAILLLNYFFKGGDPPAGPFPYPGVDEGLWDILGCDTPVPHFEPR